VSRPAARAAADVVPAAPPLKLMIVDDSQVARAVISRMLAAFTDLEIVATAADAGEALRLLPQTDVDIVLLDVEMPGESGLEALPEIETVAGAPPEAKLGCLAVGASTGGLHAVTALLRALPARIGAPILITQHLPAVFVPFFARQVETASGRIVRVAEDGLQLVPEEIVLAPGDAHIRLERKGARMLVRLDRSTTPGGCVPSVDVMLEAVADAYGPAAVGIMLSGMGRDGLAGSRRLVERGGTMLAQDRQSCAVWGMPRAVAEAGLAAAVLPPAELAAIIAGRVEAVACR
jgi:chemotaxis response regulator CheB